jgi:hypothetical protein
MPASAEAAAGKRVECNPSYRAQGKKSAKYMGKNQKCRRTDIFHVGHTPCFCVSRGNKRLRSAASWSDKETGTSPTPRYPVCAGMIGVTGAPRKCGNDWTCGIFGVGREARRLERENSPREHKEFSHVIASSSTVFCSTGTILRRKGNGRGASLK